MTRCTSCGMTIQKSATDDPYLCRTCEQEQGVEIGRFDWLDSPLERIKRSRASIRREGQVTCDRGQASPRVHTSRVFTH